MSDESTPTAAIRLAVQARVAEPPTNLEIRLYGAMARLHCMPMRIDLRSPTHVTFHHLAGSSSGKKRRAGHEQPGPAGKRRKRELALTDGGSTREPVFAAREVVQNIPVHDEPADAYIVDLGLVSVFPHYESASNPLTEIVDDCSPVDWFTEAMWLEMGLMTTSRVTLFGEAMLEPYGWTSLPGQRPLHGLLHVDLESSYSQSAANPEPWSWSFNSSLYPRFKPHEVMSTGLYVPEEYFLQDVLKVLPSVLSDLEIIANHAPPSFRLQNEDDTQFRWSTSAGTFIPPHASLPTLSYDFEQVINPGSTIRGLGHLPSPTARPATIRDIHNLAPGVAQLQGQLHLVLENLRWSSARQNSDVRSYWPSVTRDRVSLMLMELDQLEAHTWQLDQVWGSDQCRIDALQPSKVIVLAGDTVLTRRLPPSTELARDALIEIASVGCIRLGSFAHGLSMHIPQLVGSPV
ncbi:hypothetical protein ACHAPU_008087 [Fusarium lateritium]